MSWYTPIVSHIVDIIMFVISLIWFIIIIKYPWDAFFRAKGVLDEMERSKKENIAVDKDDEAFVKRKYKQLLFISLFLHFISAIAVTCVAYFLDLVIGYPFAIFYTVSACFRPLSRFYDYLMSRFYTIEENVKYPLKNVESFQNRTEKLFAEFSKKVEEAIAKKTEEINKLNADLEKLRAESASQNNRVIERYDEKFRLINDRLKNITEEIAYNQDVIKGIKAFVKMVKEQ
ncbi:MAG: hypothetical protein QW728_06935 [Thermoplasmata archaeon]